MKRIVICFLGILMLSGCTPKITHIDYNEKSLSLSLGMSKSDVSLTMGSPRRTDVNPERERWIYWNPVLIGYSYMDSEQLATDRLVITFVNNKVTKWGNQSYTDDAMEMSQKTTETIINASKK
jgi:outer membrane protein assembly factor BamE (lipoprotein component of BamABCDE complex)